MRILKSTLSAVVGLAAVTVLTLPAPAHAQTREVIVGTPRAIHSKGV